MASKTGAIRIDEKEILSSVYNPEVIKILNYQKENKSFDPMLWVKPIINRLEQTGLSTSRKFRIQMMLRKNDTSKASIFRKKVLRKHRLSEKTILRKHRFFE